MSTKNDIFQYNETYLKQQLLIDFEKVIHEEIESNKVKDQVSQYIEANVKKEVGYKIL